MIKTLKNKIYTSLAFGIFQIVISLFFGSFKFIPSETSEMMYLLIIFLSITAFEFIILFSIDRFIRGIVMVKMVYCLSFILSGIFGSVTTWFMLSGELDNIFIHTSSYFIAALVPSVLLILYYLFKDAEEKISTMGVVSLKNSEEQVTNKEKIFHLENDNGKMLLEVPIMKIICFEANDNYVMTYYLDKGENLKKSMERVSLKKIEELLLKEEVLFYRIHKSYLVNPIFIEDIKGKSQAYKLKMRYLDNQLPVSRSYDISLINL